MVSARAKRLYIITATVAISVLILGLSLFAPILSTTEDFSIYNTGWNGTSSLAIAVYKSGRLVPTFKISPTDSDLTVVHLSLDSFNLDPGKASLLVIGPSKPFSDSEGKLVGDFVRKGGRLLLADDFGTGNSLLKGMNATSRFSGRLLIDLAFEKQPEFSVCFEFNKNNNFTKGVTTLLMNFPSTIVMGKNSTVIAKSSVASYQDLDGNRLRNWRDPIGPFPLIAMERLGLGEILLISDPSMLINGMLMQGDNEVFANNTLFFLGDGRGEVFFDESHRSYFDPVTVSITAIGKLSDFAKGLIVALVTVVLLTFLTEYPRIVSRKIFNASVWLWHTILNALSRKKGGGIVASPLTNEELIAAVMGKHPEWKRSLLMHILTQAEYHRKVKWW